MREQLNFFRAHGYCAIPGALSAKELATLNGAIDRDREQYPQLWQHRGEGGRYQNATVLLSSQAFDMVIRHPAVLGLVEELMGSELCFEELSVMVREPQVQDPPQAVWHRDTSHWSDHPLALRNLSLVYYLTAVDAASHCFAIVPETVEQKRCEYAAPDPQRAVELYGKAGTAIVFNAGSGHAGVVKKTQCERRTIHVYYGHRRLPPMSDHTVVPRRLVEGGDEAARHFYGRPNLATTLALENF